MWHSIVLIILALAVVGGAETASLRTDTSTPREVVVNAVPSAGDVLISSTALSEPVAAANVEDAAEEAALPLEDEAPSADVLVVQAVLPEAAEPYASPFRMPVPFRSQKDGSQYQGSNCGPAALAMILEAYGIVEDNNDLRFRMHTYQGTVGRRGGTALEHVATVGRDYGLDPIGLYEGEGFHRWTVDEIRQQVADGSAVVPLVKYRLLPGNEGSTIRFDHYIVIHGIDGDRFRYHDPAYADAERGSGRWITSDQLAAAIGQSSIPGQAVAFAGGRLGRLPALPI